MLGLARGPGSTRRIAPLPTLPSPCRPPRCCRTPSCCGRARTAPSASASPTCATRWGGGGGGGGAGGCCGWSAGGLRVGAGGPVPHARLSQCRQPASSCPKAARYTNPLPAAPLTIRPPGGLWRVVRLGAAPHPHLRRPGGCASLPRPAGLLLCPASPCLLMVVAALAWLRERAGEASSAAALAARASGGNSSPPPHPCCPPLSPVPCPRPARLHPAGGRALAYRRVRRRAAAGAVGRGVRAHGAARGARRRGGE